MLILLYISIALVLFGVLIRINDPFKNLMYSGISGLISLGVLSALSSALSLTVSLNLFTLVTAFLLGVPGVVGMLLINLF